MRLAIIIDKDLPPGLAANTAAILGMSIGKAVPESVGPDIPDAAGSLHPGITNLPVPVLGAESRALGDLRTRAAEIPGVRYADFTDVAQQTRTYEEYIGRLLRSEPGAIRYLGVCLYGDDKAVRGLTVGLSLLGR